MLDTNAEDCLNEIRLGEFSIFSFSKHIFPEYTNDYWSIMDKMKSMTDIEVYEKSMELFHSLNDDDKKNYILQNAVDVHESHHFHSYLLIPIGNVIFENLYEFIIQNVTTLLNIKDRIDSSDKNAFMKSQIGFTVNSKSFIDYYLSGNLPVGNIDQKAGHCPISYIFKYPCKLELNNTIVEKDGFMPVFKIGNKICPLGLISIMKPGTETRDSHQLFQFGIEGMPSTG